MPSTRRHKSTRISCTFVCHKSRHVFVLRTAYSLAQWLNFHSLSTVYKVSYSACISFMFSRWRCYFAVYSFWTSKRQSTSPSTWMRTWKHRWRLELLQAMRCWMTYSGSFWWYSRVIYQRMKRTNFVTSVIPCQCTVDGIYAYEWEHSSVSKQKLLVTTNGLSECLHRQTSDQVL
jgi:hypothetical protein